MLVFLVGSSSVGKSTLLRWLKRNLKTCQTLNADDFYGKARGQAAELFREKNKTGDTSWEAFSKTNWRQDVTRAWHEHLVQVGRQSEVCFVDTVVRGIQDDLTYIRKHQVIHKVVCVAVDLAHLFWNIVQRNIKTTCPKAPHEARSAGVVLEEVFGLWTLSPTPTDVVFDKQHLDYFNLFLDVMPASWQCNGLRSVQNKFTKTFFPTKKLTRVHVEPSWSGYDFVVLHHKTHVAGKQIMGFLQG